MSKGLLKFFDVSYFLKFGILLTVLYYFNIFYIGITAPGGWYSPFLNHYLNYIAWISNATLYTSKAIDYIFGLTAYVDSSYNLYVPDGASVGLRYSCIGLGIMSFWIAFITAHKGDWEKKLIWCLGGLIIIWSINCWRIAVLLIALERNWKVNKYMDHHALFNLIAYFLIMLMMYVYGRKGSGKNKLNPGAY